MCGCQGVFLWPIFFCNLLFDDYDVICDFVLYYSVFRRMKVNDLCTHYFCSTITSARLSNYDVIG